MPKVRMATPEETIQDVVIEASDKIDEILTALEDLPVPSDEESAASLQDAILSLQHAETMLQLVRNSVSEDGE